MTTEHIREEAEAARKALGQVAQKAQQRSREVASKRKGLQRERESLVIGSRAAMRDVDDEDDVLDEEEQQLREILEGLPETTVQPKEPEAAATDSAPPDDSEPPKAPEPPVESPSSSVFDQDAPEQKADKDFVPNPPYTSAQLRGMSNARLHVVAKYFDMDMPVTDRNRDNVIVYILSCQARKVADVEQTSIRKRVVDIIDVREWTGLQWLLAILGAIIGLIVANATWGMYDDINGFGRGLLVTLWFVFVASFGFFLGGFLGSLWEYRGVDVGEEEI